MSRSRPRVLQVGLGAFGQNHVRAWMDLGLRDRYWLAEVDRDRLHQAADRFGLARDRLTADFRSVLADVDLVDIVTPTDSHFELCRASLEAGKDVFVEKPMTMTATEARHLRSLVAGSDRLLQVGYYYRFHPGSRWVRHELAAGNLGTLRYLGGTFMGFKRARTDVGVTHTDAVHFIDLFNWIVGGGPRAVYAVTRDHFNRGLEDFSLVVLHYANDVVARIESGYIQPGRWRDKVVPNAVTTKEVIVCGSAATAEIDYEQDLVHLHRVHHELQNGIWTAISEGTDTPNLGTASPIQMIAAELDAFLEAVAFRRRPDANEVTAGVTVADAVEAIYESSRTGAPVAVPAQESASG